MTWTADSGNKYKLIQLDTNVLSEILKSDTIKKIFLEKFGPSDYAICFTIYNVIEIRRRMDLFESLLNFFSFYPSFLLKTHGEILIDELIYKQIKSEVILLNAFSVFGKSKSYDFRKFFESLFEDKKIISAERLWHKEEKEILASWISLKDNFEAISQSTNTKDAEKYVYEAGIQSLIRQFPAWAKVEIEENRVPEINQFPSLKIMLYSQYYRLFEESRKTDLQDVTDVRIMASSPYMDAIVTENFQSEIFRKIKRIWDGIDNLEVYTLKDLRR